MADSKKTDAVDPKEFARAFNTGTGGYSTLFDQNDELADRLESRPQPPPRQEVEPTGPSRAQLAANFLGEPARLAALCAKYAAPPPVDYDDLQPAQARPSDISDHPRPSFWIARACLQGARGTRDSATRKTLAARRLEREAELVKKHGRPKPDIRLWYFNHPGTDDRPVLQEIAEWETLEREEDEALAAALAAAPRPGFGGVTERGRPFWYGTGGADSFQGSWACNLAVVLCMEPDNFPAALKHCRARHHKHQRYGYGDRALVVLGWEPDVTEVTAIEATGAALEHLGGGFERWLKQQTGRPARAGL